MVVPLCSSSDAAYRADAASDAGGMRGLHRPDPRLEPVEQGQIVRIAAEDRLAQMDVGLDEPGQQERAPGVDGAVDALAGVDAADGGDAPVPDQQIAFDNVEGVVHGEDGRAADG